MNEKKVTIRNVAITLGIIYIIFAVVLVGAVANYTSKISGKDNTITTNNSQILALTNQLNQLQAWLAENKTLLRQQIQQLQNTITNLQSQINDLNDIVNLAKSTVWVDSQTVSQPANSYAYWRFSAIYAGYVSVYVQTSTTTNTYVRVIYSSHGVNYDNQIGVGTGRTVVFPVLPSSTIEIRVGNSNWLDGATETVTITLYY